ARGGTAYMFAAAPTVVVVRFLCHTARVSQGERSSVELRSVTKTYGPVRALVGVSATFDAGKVSMVLGPNGSGKSTLLAIVATLTRPTSGKVVHGAGRGMSRREVRAALGWVGHESLCYVDLSGRENIELAARLYGL